MTDLINDVRTSSGLLLDANLLVVLLVGNHFGKIDVCRKASSYTMEDHKKLVRISGLAKKLVTTPNILTEVSNLSGTIPKELHKNFYPSLFTWSKSCTEIYLETSSLIKSQCLRLGVTDVGITEISELDLTYLTADFSLYNELLFRNKKAYNYNHIRFIPIS